MGKTEKDLLLSEKPPLSNDKGEGEAEAEGKDTPPAPPAPPAPPEKPAPPAPPKKPEKPKSDSPVFIVGGILVDHSGKPVEE